VPEPRAGHRGSTAGGADARHASCRPPAAFRSRTAGHPATRPSLSVALPSALDTRAALAALADAVCTAGADFRVAYWNPAAGRLFGIAPEEALGRLLWEILPEMGQSGARERLCRAADEGGALDLTITSERELFPRHLRVTVSPLGEGAFALHFRDVTREERVAEQYAQLLESMRDGFVAVDREWRIAYVNRAAELLVLIRRQRAVGASLWELFPTRPEHLARAVRATMQDRQPRTLTGLHPEGRIFRRRAFDVRIDPLPDGGLSLLFDDVTERLAKEVQLARLAAEAEEANRAKSRFFAAVSHELRTPLNAIVGYTHLLATHTFGAVPDGAARAAERASVCAEHLARLVDDVLLLTTAELDRLRVFPAAVDLAVWLPPHLEHLSQQAEAKRLRFHLRVQPGMGPFRTDPDRLRQILTALVTNAVKFTPSGEVAVLAGESAGGVEIRVEDSGPGISEAERERIFAPFEQIGEEARSDSMNRGSGLGLTVARRLATLLGGTLRAERSALGGAAFVLELPAGEEGDGGTGW
jgi:PAS domain S-box-containing protein